MTGWHAMGFHRGRAFVRVNGALNAGEAGEAAVCETISCRSADGLF